MRRSNNFILISSLVASYIRPCTKPNSAPEALLVVVASAEAAAAVVLLLVLVVVLVVVVAGVVVVKGKGTNIGELNGTYYFTRCLPIF